MSEALAVRDDGAAKETVDVSHVKTEPLREPLPEAGLDAVEQPVEQQPAPTVFEQSYWEADDEAIGKAWEALVDPTTGMVPRERFLGFAEFTYHIAVQNRLREREMTLQISQLMTAVAALIEAQEAKAAPKKRSTKVPKAALPAVTPVETETPEAPDAA
jgi:hypothetical protein